MNAENTTIVINHGSERLNTIKDDDILKVLTSGYDAIVLLAEIVHFNRNYPKFKNIYISNLNTQYVHVFLDGEWQYKLKTNIINDLYRKLRNHIKKVIDVYRNTNKLTASQIDDIDRLIDRDENDNVAKKIKIYLMLLLKNMRHLVIGVKL